MVSVFLWLAAPSLLGGVLAISAALARGGVIAAAAPLLGRLGAARALLGVGAALFMSACLKLALGSFGRGGLGRPASLLGRREEAGEGEHPVGNGNAMIESRNIRAAYLVADAGSGVCLVHG